jgi:hypothetical protein
MRNALNSTTRRIMRRVTKLKWTGITISFNLNPAVGWGGGCGFWSAEVFVDHSE